MSKYQLVHHGAEHDHVQGCVPFVHPAGDKHNKGVEGKQAACPFEWKIRC